MHQRHNDPMAYIASLDDPKRDEYQKPDEVLKALALRPGEVVADIGAGSGYFALRFARAVGDAGRVYAVDISPDMVRHLNRRLRDAGVRNVVTVLSDPDDPLLPDASVDRFVIVDTWHHVEDQAKYLGSDEAHAEAGRPGRAHRLPEARAADRSAAGDEDRPRGPGEADGGRGLPPQRRAHVPAVPVLPGLHASGGTGALSPPNAQSRHSVSSWLVVAPPPS